MLLAISGSVIIVFAKNVAFDFDLGRETEGLFEKVVLESGFK